VRRQDARSAANPLSKRTLPLSTPEEAVVLYQQRGGGCGSSGRLPRGGAVTSLSERG
jgi:hypothetical protein